MCIRWSNQVYFRYNEQNTHQFLFMPSFEKTGLESDEAVLDPQEDVESLKTPEQLRREGEIRALALQAQNRFVTVVENFGKTYKEPDKIRDEWKGESSPLLGTFLRICRETLDALGLRDVSENDVVQVEFIPLSNPIGLKYGHGNESTYRVYLGKYCVYSITEGGEYPIEFRCGGLSGERPKIETEFAEIPVEFQTEADYTFSRIAFERGLSDLLAEHGR